MDSTVSKTLQRVDRRRVRNNTQRALLALLNANGSWVARTSIRLPSVTSRLRDLRKEEFGGFDVQCVSARDLQRSEKTRTTSRLTYYRLNPNTVTVKRLNKAFEGVI